MPGRNSRRDRRNAQNLGAGCDGDSDGDALYNNLNYRNGIIKRFTDSRLAHSEELDPLYFGINEEISYEELFNEGKATK